METIYRASRCTLLLHSVADWLGHTWGWLSDEVVCESVLRAASKGELSPAGVAGEIDAACAAYLSPGVKGWGITSPAPSTLPDGDEELVIPIGAAARLTADWQYSAARYTYLYRDGGEFSVFLRMEEDGRWRPVSVSSTRPQPRPRDIFRAAVVLAQADIYLPDCTEDIRRAVAAEYNDESLATGDVANVGPWIFAAPVQEA